MSDLGSGPQLRQDDPSAAKDIVLLLQRAMSNAEESKLSVRTKFMVETINDLKNNKLRAGIGSSSVRSEALIQIKKVLGQLNTRHVQASEPLRIGLQDIRDTEKRGKWWLVGASWRNDNENGKMSQSRSAESSHTNLPGEPLEVNDGENANLLRLAREQQMNTDVRRAIFVSIMSAEDYKDAHTRLTKLRLKRAQEIEIPRVLIHCAGAEQVYNPYYTIIARKLCANRKLKMAFQFCLWSLFKAMGEGDDDATNHGYDGDEEEQDQMSTRKIVNLAKFFGTLIAEGTLELAILKVGQNPSLYVRCKVDPLTRLSILYIYNRILEVLLSCS